VFASDCVAGLFSTSYTGVDRIFASGARDPIWRVTLKLPAPVTLPAGTYFFSHDAAIVSPFDRKSAAVAALQDAVAGAAQDIAQRIGTAVQAVQSSLTSAYWLDEQTLTVDGKHVFDRERQAVQHLQHALGREGTSSVETATVLGAIEALVKADQGIALGAIAGADAAAVAAGCTPGSPDPACQYVLIELETARRWYEESLSDGTAQPDNAIQDAWKAWMHAGAALSSTRQRMAAGGPADVR
jgi:hypothetical protein